MTSTARIVYRCNTYSGVIRKDIVGVPYFVRYDIDPVYDRIAHMLSKLSSAYSVLRADGPAQLVRAVGDEILSPVFERFNRYDSVYRLDLKYRGYSLSPRDPTYSPDSVVLQTVSEYEAAISELRRCGLVPHNDSPKNWDHLTALTAILNRTDRTANVLDAGGETYSPLVHWLYLYDYRDLYVCNLSFDEPFNQGPIQYLPQDITDTSFPDGSFDVITCLSVIEHGVDVQEFLTEAKRLLQDDGLLVISTDYWPDGVDSNGVTAYGLPWEPFDTTDVAELVESAEATGFRVLNDLDLEATDRPVKWRGMEYTFVVLEFEIAE